MVDIITRLAKGLPLTNIEMDTNLTNLKTAIEAFGITTGGTSTTGAFYGFKYNRATGALTYDVIDDGTLIRPSLYELYFRSEVALEFTINADGHLQVKVL
jgi:hypothetical protein